MEPGIAGSSPAGVMFVNIHRSLITLSPLYTARSNQQHVFDIGLRPLRIEPTHVTLADIESAHRAIEQRDTLTALPQSGECLHRLVARTSRCGCGNPGSTHVGDLR